MQGRLSDERVVVVGPKHPRGLERADDDGDRLELRPALRDGLLIDDKCLDVKFVRELLEAGVIGNLGGEQEQPQTRLGRLDPVVER